VGGLQMRGRRCGIEAFARCVIWAYVVSDALDLARRVISLAVIE
jgi:hypothetical protein